MADTTPAVAGEAAESSTSRAGHARAMEARCGRTVCQAPGGERTHLGNPTGAGDRDAAPTSLGCTLTPHQRRAKAQRDADFATAPDQPAAWFNRKQLDALIAAGLDTPKSLAALTRSELLKRPGIGPATAAAVVGWLAAHGLALRPEKAKAPKPSAKPYADVWAELWPRRKCGKYRFDWFRDSGLLLQMAEVVGNDLARFRAALEVFHSWEDEGRWATRAASIGKARHWWSDLVNAPPPCRRRNTFRDDHAADAGDLDLTKAREDMTLFERQVADMIAEHETAAEAK